MSCESSVAFLFMCLCLSNIHLVALYVHDVFLATFDPRSVSSQEAYIVFFQNKGEEKTRMATDASEAI